MHNCVKQAVSLINSAKENYLFNKTEQGWYAPFISAHQLNG